MSDNILVGKTITGMKIASDRQALLFETALGNIEVGVDADCCSHTWVESVELPALGFPALVVSVEDLDLPQTDKPSAYNEHPDVVSYYGCKIITTSGEIVIDYRNDSNGYYGGNLSWPGSYFYGGVYGQNISSQTWVEIQS